MPRCRRKRSRSRRASCSICASSFVTRHSQGKYCSDKCSREGERKSWREYGERNRKARRAYHRKLYEKNSEAIIRRIKKYHQTKRGRLLRLISDERRRKMFPEKCAARQAVMVAIRSGKLKRQKCEKCGDQKTQAHHRDYSRPLYVQWLCAKCHGAAHRKVYK